MAAEGGDDASKSESDNSRLDFFSPDFDPLLALRTQSLQPPIADAKTFDNMAMYESSKKPKREEQSRRKMALEGESTTTLERKWLPHQMPVESKRTRPTRNVLTKMESIQGPLAALRKCKDERIRLKIWTRHSHGIRGYCLAYITAFDKHWNMALEEITEVWTRPKRRKIPALETYVSTKKTKKKLTPPQIVIRESSKKTETCERYVKQMLLRGEHVAFLVILNDINQK